MRRIRSFQNFGPSFNRAITGNRIGDSFTNYTGYPQRLAATCHQSGFLTCNTGQSVSALRLKPTNSDTNFAGSVSLQKSATLAKSVLAGTNFGRPNSLQQAHYGSCEGRGAVHAARLGDRRAEPAYLK